MFWEDMGFKSLIDDSFVYISEEREETLYEDVESELYGNSDYTSAYGKKKRGD